MKESYIKKLYSERITLASKTKKTVQEKTLNPDVLDFSSEEPDATADILVVDTLYREASKWENRGCGDNSSLSAAAAEYLYSQFGVAGLDTETELCATGGTRSALRLLASAFVNRGDTALVPAPSVTTFNTSVMWCGGSVVNIPLTEQNGFLPRYEDIPQKRLKKAKLLYINYPNNPTGKSATADFFVETVSFAKLNGLIVLHDAAFSALAYDEEKRLSFLSAKGALKVGLELHSMSQAFNMAGWRAGFIAGNKNIIKAYREMAYKSGAGQYTPILKAAAYALSQPEISVKTAKKYERRAKLFTDALQKLGMKAEMPEAGYYIYAKTPSATVCGQQFSNARAFEKFLLSNGVKTKAFGDEFIRYSLTFYALGSEEESKVVDAFVNKLSRFEFLF